MRNTVPHLTHKPLRPDIITLVVMHQLIEVSQCVWKCHLTSERCHIRTAFVVGLPRQQSKSILQCGPRESSAWTFPACVQSIKFKENNKDKPWWPHTSKHRWIQGLLWKALCTCTGSAWFDVTNYLRINTSCSQDTIKCHPFTKPEISYDRKIVLKDTTQYMAFVCKTWKGRKA